MEWLFVSCKLYISHAWFVFYLLWSKLCSLPDNVISHDGKYKWNLSRQHTNIEEWCIHCDQVNYTWLSQRCRQDCGGDLHETLQIPWRNQRIWFEKDIALVWLTEDELALPMISFRISWYFFLFLENGYKIVLSYEFKDVYFCFTCSFYSSIDIRCK